jgi:hypothetical protein
MKQYNISVKNSTSCLLRVNANSIVRDNGRGGRIDFEFFGGKLENGREGRGFRNAQPVPHMKEEKRPNEIK